MTTGARTRTRRLRRVRRAWASRLLWQRRAILLAGAVAIGLAAVALAVLSDAAGTGFRRLAETAPYATLAITPIGFAFAHWVTRALCHGAQGSGIPQVIAARESHHAHRLRLLSPRVTIGKFLLVLFGLGIGAAIGREGPTVQIGAAIMFTAGRFAGIGRQRGLVLAGAAAGIAAAFNTPLAGVMFAIEELAKSFEPRLTAIIAAAVVLAGLTSLAIMGNYSYFGSVAMSFAHGADWLAVPLAALVGGVLGGLFSRVVVRLTRRQPRMVPHGRWNGILFAFLCGLGVALLALATGFYASGTGYEATRDLLETGRLLPWWYAPAKLAATVLSSVAAIPGGLFSPSLSVGAGLGSLIAPFLPGTDPTTLATLTMVGYFAGVVQSPLTAFVIVMEMTTSQRTSLPLMATALMASGISRLISRHPLYHALSHGWLERHPRDAAAVRAA